MHVAKPAGRNAAVLKYDILSALGVQALSADKHRQRLILRVIVLLTTRYNWQRNELSIGRAEIARLWSVDERTVKREMAKLRSHGWIEVKRPAAKGRVAVYALNLDAMLTETAPHWATIGPDFETRMQDRHGGAGEAAPDPKVIPFQPRARSAPAEGAWAQVLDRLRHEAPALATAWFGQLSEAEREGGQVVLSAPSRFVADYVATHHMSLLLSAYRGVDPAVRHIRIEG
ncbi:hypothetical protein JYP51_08970 [Ponticoccus gilvus]|nr:hypothetical protein [Enemella evansiae]